MGVCGCGLPVNSVCVCVCAQLLHGRTDLSVPHWQWEKLSDSSDRKAQVTERYEQKNTDHFCWGFLLFLFATALRQRLKDCKAHISCTFACIFGLKLQSYDLHRQFCLDILFFFFFLRSVTLNQKLYLIVYLSLKIAKPLNMPVQPMRH